MSPLPAPTFPFPLFQVRDGDGWQKVSARETYADPYIQIERADYLTPGRPNQPVPWTIAHRKAAVAIAPVLEDGRYLLIAQERLPVQDTLWEFPAGQIDIANSPTPHQTIIDTALAELREEAGVALHPELGRLEPLGYFLPSQGFTTEHVYLFRAEPVCVVGLPEPEASEHISTVRPVSAGELRRMIADNEITNALTLALFARMSAKGQI
jgi:8-oxo-dGTP pyrophosphatase MutT (NUDIX family)